MDDTRRVLYGYDLDEIDEVAAEIFTLIGEQQVPNTFAILALCRTITMMGSEHDLDLACVMIDQLRELSNDEESEEDPDDEDSEV